MNRRNAISICGIITFIATIILSKMCIDDWSGLTKWAFGTILGSEIVFFSGLLFAEYISQKTEQIITRVALYVLLSAYMLINVAVSVVFITSYKDENTSFVNTEVIIHALLFIAIIVFLTAGRSIYKSNRKTMANLANAEAMIGRLNKLAALDKCLAYRSALNKISDELRFSDISSPVLEDMEINKAISVIELEIVNDTETSEKVIKDALINLKSLVAQRNITISMAKKGNI